MELLEGFASFLCPSKALISEIDARDTYSFSSYLAVNSDQSPNAVWGQEGCLLLESS